MPTSRDSPRQATSPPYIFGSDMLESLDSHPDFEFFDCNQFDAAASPGVFASQDQCASPNLTNKLPPAYTARPSRLDTKVQLSAPSSASPTESDRDSASETSKGKRYLSSNSSPSAGDNMMADTLMADEWKIEDGLNENGTTFASYDGTINPMAIDSTFHFNDKQMENDFDFESASNSPSPLADLGLADKQNMKYDTSRRNSAMLGKATRHSKVIWSR
jgi:hypothetical protein